MKKLSVARQYSSRLILTRPAYFDGAGTAGAGAAGAGVEAGAVGAGTAGVGALDVLENCCNTELPVEAAVEF